jgi:HEAT repeats
MIGFPQASVLVLQLFFASLMLLAANSAQAKADNVSYGLHSSPSPSIKITLSKQDDAVIILETITSPLGQILKAITDKTGAVIHYSVLPEAPVTATCVGANVGQIMDCLVAKQIGLVTNKPQKDEPAEFWLLGSSVGSCQAVTIAPNPLPSPETAAFQPEYLPEAPKITNRQQSDALLSQLKNAKTPQERAEALTNMVSGAIIDDPAVRKALDDAVLDTNATIRAQAISTLANLDKEGSAEILAGALHDSDAAVRLTAIDQLDSDIEALKQALSDSDASIRDYAAAKLADIKNREEKKIAQSEE